MKLVAPTVVFTAGAWRSQQRNGPTQTNDPHPAVLVVTVPVGPSGCETDGTGSSGRSADWKRSTVTDTGLMPPASTPWQGPPPRTPTTTAVTE